LRAGEEERSALRAASEEAKSSGKLSKERVTELRSRFGERFERALKLIEERRVKRYAFEPSGRIVWVVVGKEKEYQILPRAGYCSCDDFYFRVINGETGLCYHLIAQSLAEALGIYEEIKEGDEFYESLIAEWRSQSLEP